MNILKKKSLKIIIVAVVMGGVGFYSGMKYGESKTPFTKGGLQNLRNLSPEERQARMQGSGAFAIGGGQGGRMMGRQGSGFMSGEIISKDDKSVTIKLRARQDFTQQNLGGQDGGSKIVFYSDATKISKSMNGAVSDLEVGKSVSVSGKAEQNGSITAQSIKIISEVAPKQ